MVFNHKIVQIGNSVGVVIPQVLARQIPYEAGMPVSISNEDKTIVITPQVDELFSGGVDARFMKMVDDFVESHKDVLAELAKR